MRSVLALVLVALAAAAAAASPTGRIVGTVKLTDADGRPAPASEVIVYVVGFTEPHAAGPPVQIAQRGRAFVPDLVAITVGDTVSFPNADPFLHNVFSLSTARKFDLGSFKRGDAKDKLFPSPGVVDVYCNIHPEMAATILVLPNRAHTRVGADGTFTLAGIPAGEWTVFAYTRRAARPVSAHASVKPGADTTLALALARGAEPEHLNKYGETYRPVTTTYR